MEGRSRGYSLRTQLFKKKHNGEESSEGDGIEMDRLANDDENLEAFTVESLKSELPTNKNRKELGRWNKFINLILNRRAYANTEAGRIIPLSLDKSGSLYQSHSLSNYLIDERTNKPYCNNVITSSRYTVYSFFPRQLYAQYSKIANAYFLLVAILQMVPSWSTTGTYTTIVPLMIFLSISMAREAWDDIRRHKLDKEENDKLTKVLAKENGYDGTLDDSIYSLSNASTTSSAAMLDDFDTSLNNSEQESSTDNCFTDFNVLRAQYDIHVKKKKWKNLEVGDIVLLNADDMIPADLMLLASDGDNDEVFVETMALDGETNLKSKHPLSKVSKVMNTAVGLSKGEAVVTVEDPNNDLYNFEGTVVLNGETHPLGPDNVVYRGSVIRNTRNLLGLVIFTGEETKIRMNAIRNPRTKAPKLQKSINLIVIFMVIIVASMAFFSFFGEIIIKRQYVDTNKAWYLLQQDAGVAPTVMSFIIMYNTLIPLSLYVTMEIIKVMQSKFMEWDIDMYHFETNTPCESRTATILEELGQVSYIFSDKTGTLTDNKMIFRKFSIDGTSWVHEVEKDTQFKSTSEGDDVDVISEDDRSFINRFDLEVQSTHFRTSVEYKGNSSATYTGRPSMALEMENRKLERDLAREATIDSSQNKKTSHLKTSLDLLLYIQRNPNSYYAKRAKFFLLGLALCHSCLPKKLSDDNMDMIHYQSSSPDELALVTAARDMGFVVLNKNASILTIKTYPNGFENEPVLEDYEILETIDFDSHRKRMSVLVKIVSDPGRILLICKGADNVILERLHNSELAQRKILEQQNMMEKRKIDEAELVLKQRRSLEHIASRESMGTGLRHSLSERVNAATLKLEATRRSLSRSGTTTNDSEFQINSIDDFLSNVEHERSAIDGIVEKSKNSLRMQQQDKYNTSGLVQENSYIENEALLLNDEFIIERTLNAIDSFSTEGLRTLLFSYKWIPEEDYNNWELKYHSAKTSLTNRAEQIATIGEEIELDLHLLGATAIEDKLQEGVPDAIDKIRRAGIKMWMLTGDKRETAISIGYSCKLIHDYSSVVILRHNDDGILSKMTALGEELDNGNVAHCVVVIDGTSLALFENNPTLMSVFIELCVKTDSVICCRASPSQKALMVSKIRTKNIGLVTLAIGDGANDIAMIQSADIGVGIAGKEGLQASRSSDYSIGQFRFLLKLLFVHGRYNYVRTAKFVLCTFFKEVCFYLTQMIYQRQTMFSGSSLYESWSLSMFNTLFTSLPVLCIGMFEKDLKPMTLLAVPELYVMGQKSEAFNLKVFLLWMATAGSFSVLVTFLNFYAWGFTALSDNTVYPLGLINYCAIVFLINIKCQMIEMKNRNSLAFASMLISCLGWLLWCCLLPAIHSEDPIYDVKTGLFDRFGRDVTWWASILVLTVLPLLLNIIVSTVKASFWPSDSDIFAELEKRDDIRKKLEHAAYTELRQGWCLEKEPGSVKRLVRKGLRKSKISGETPSKKHPSKLHKVDFNDYEVLPSGKLIKKQVPSLGKKKGGKKLRFKIRSKLEDSEVDEIIAKRMQDLE